MVCLGVFLTQFTIIGIDNSFGVVIGSLVELLDSNTSNVSWIHSIHSSFMFFFASISSILLKKFGLRSVILIGTTLSCASYIAPIFLQNYVGLLLTYGILGGAGSGLLFTPANIACTKYFDKWRSLAMGISMSGGGCGTMAVSLLCNYINIKFGCKGYFITLSLLSTLTFIFGFFASPLKPTDEEDKGPETNKPPKIVITESATPYNKKIEIGDENLVDPKENPLQNRSQQRRRSSIAYGPNLTVHMEARQGRRSSIAMDAHIDMVKDKPNTDEKISNTNGILTLLKDKGMFCYCLVHIFFELAYYTPMVYLPEMMYHDRGISHEWAGTIIAILGICNMGGKVFTGLILQWLKMSPVLFSAITLVLLASSCIGLTFCMTYGHFVGVTAAYGVMLSSVDVCLPLILIELLGDGKLKDGFSLIMVCKMFSPIWGPPIGGALKDWTDHYNLAFYASGSFQLIAAFFNILVLIFQIKGET